MSQTADTRFLVAGLRARAAHRFVWGAAGVVFVVLFIPVFFVLLSLFGGLAAALEAYPYLVPFFYIGTVTFNAPSGSIAEARIVPFPLAFTLVELAMIAFANGFIAVKTPVNSLASAALLIVSVCVMHYVVIHAAHLPMIVRGIHI